MTSKTLLAVGLGGVVATTVGIATAQPSIADSLRTIQYTTSPAPILVPSYTASQVEIDVDRDDGEVEIDVDKDKEHGLFRNIVGMPMRLIKAPLALFSHDDDEDDYVAVAPLGAAPATVTTRTVPSAIVVDDSCNHSKIITSSAVIDMTVESPAVIRSTTGAPFMVEKNAVHRPVMRKVVSRPSVIEVNRVVEKPVVVQRVISQPTVIEKFVEKPAIIDYSVAQPVFAAPVVRRTVSAPVIILDDDSDRFLYDFSTHRMLKLDLDD